MMDVAYFTCRNNDCELHRNIFIEGDSRHENCERERLYLRGQRRQPPVALWIGLAVAAAAAAVTLLALSRARSAGDSDREDRMLREETDAWNAGFSQPEQRSEQSAPPPLS